MEQNPKTPEQPKPPSRRRAALVVMMGGYAHVIALMVTGFALVPVYLRYIDDTLYGAWLGSGDIIAWLAVLDMGLASVMIQRVAATYGENDHTKAATYFIVGLTIQLIFVTVLVVLAVVVSSWVPDLMGLEGDDASLISLCFVLAASSNAISIIVNGIAGLSIALQRPAFTNILAIVGTIGRFFLAIGLLMGGMGLLAIPLSYLIRGIFLLLTNGAYALWLLRTEIRAPVRPSLTVIRELVVMSPPLFLAKLGNAAMNRSEVALVAIFIKPELAIVFSLTRRGSEVIEMFLYRFGAAVFPGMANLVGSDQRSRAGKIYHQVMSLYTSTGVLLTATYLAANYSFMAVWVGTDQFGGVWLTVLIGISVLFNARASLLSYLYGGTGRIVASSYLVVLEGIIRLPLMIVLMGAFDLPGFPLAKTLTALVACEITSWLIRKELTGNTQRQEAIRLRLAITYGGILLVAMVLGTIVWPASWFGLILGTAVFISLSTLILFWADHEFGDFLYTIAKQIRRLVFKRLQPANAQR